jgi:hypothetical protein
MFEGIPHIYLDSPETSLFIVSVISCALIVWIRQGFIKEWKLADLTLNNINRIWQRGADEVPQTEGIIVSHIVGIIAYGILAWHLWTFWLGVATGVALLILRQTLYWILGLVSKTSILSKEHNIIDRVIRMWMSAVLSLGSILVSLLPCTLLVHPELLFFSIWCLWTIFRWYRVFQSALRRFNRLSHSFLYLCALEILPVCVFVQVMITFSQGF